MAPPLLRPRMPSVRRQLRNLGLLAALAVGVTVLGGVIANRLQPPASLLAVGTPAPAIDLLGPGPAHSDAVAEARGAGRQLVVEFFETGCPHCQAIAPRICSLLAGHPGVEVVSVEAAQASPRDVAGFRRDHLGDCARDARLLTLADPCRHPAAGGCGNVTERWKVSAVPTLYLVDGHGDIAFAGAGESAVDGVQTALGAGSPGG